MRSMRGFLVILFLFTLNSFSFAASDAQETPTERARARARVESPNFQNMGTPYGGTTWVMGLSGDGSTVIGDSLFAGGDFWPWSWSLRNPQATPLELPGFRYIATPFAVSRDGKLIAGVGETFTSPGSGFSIREGGTARAVQPIIPLAPGTRYSSSQNLQMIPNSSKILGRAHYGMQTPNGFESHYSLYELEHEVGGNLNINLFQDNPFAQTDKSFPAWSHFDTFFTGAVSHDGSKLVGLQYGAYVNGRHESTTYVWNRNNHGLQVINPISNPENNIYASSISADGTIVAGNERVDSLTTRTTYRAFIWTKENGTVHLPFSNPFTTPIQYLSTIVGGMSADGNMLVGCWYGLPENSPPFSRPGCLHPLLYRKSSAGVYEMYSIVQLIDENNQGQPLLQYPPEQRFFMGISLSEDGMTILGLGIPGPKAPQQAWRLKLEESWFRESAGRSTTAVPHLEPLHLNKNGNCNTTDKDKVDVIFREDCTSSIFRKLQKSMR